METLRLRIVELPGNGPYGTLIVEAGSQILLSWDRCPVERLKIELRRWLERTSDANPSTFVYPQDGHGEEIGMLRIEPRPNGWQFTSIEERGRHRPIDWHSMRSALESII